MLQSCYLDTESDRTPRFYHRFPPKVNRQIAQNLSKFFYPRIYKLFTIHKKFTFTPQKRFFVQPSQNSLNRILNFCTPCTKIFRKLGVAIRAQSDTIKSDRGGTPQRYFKKRGTYLCMRSMVRLGMMLAIMRMS